MSYLARLTQQQRALGHRARVDHDRDDLFAEVSKRFVTGSVRQRGWTFPGDLTCPRLERGYAPPQLGGRVERIRVSRTQVRARRGGIVNLDGCKGVRRQAGRRRAREPGDQPPDGRHPSCSQNVAVVLDNRKTTNKVWHVARPCLPMFGCRSHNGCSARRRHRRFHHHSTSACGSAGTIATSTTLTPSPTPCALATARAMHAPTPAATVEYRLGARTERSRRRRRRTHHGLACSPNGSGVDMSTSPPAPRG